MDIVKFQEKLTEICKLGEENGKVLKPEQVKECFQGMDLEKEQLIKILQYLKSKGISIEGAQEQAKSQEEEQKETESQQERVPLTPEEEEYLKEYLNGLQERGKSYRDSEELFALLAQKDAQAKEELSQKYLETAAQMAVEMNSRDVFLGDLIQEASMALFMALESAEEMQEQKTEEWLLKEMRKRIRDSIGSYEQRSFEDDCLVAKVEKLESAVRELTEDEEEGSEQFSIGELAVILDMDEEEIRDILRLTGDDK